MNALLFPGQGSQQVGMGKDLYDNFSLVKKIFEEANEYLNYDITKIILEGPAEKLQLTENTQPAILTVSYSIFKVLKEEFGLDLKNFSQFAGHSLGEYSALVCAGALDFKDAVNLLYQRGKAMQNAVPVGQGMMLAVLGIELSELKDLIEKQENIGVCEIANDNAKGQIIISGEKKSVSFIQSELKKNKIKIIPLKVSAPFHCTLMKPAEKVMSEKIKNTNFKKPSHKIITNVTAQEVKEPEEIKKLLIEQICSTVRWRESIINIFKSGVKHFVEIGPGKVLSGMVKRTLTANSCFSINTIDDIKNYNNEFKK